MIEKLLVPDIGDFENVEIIELLVKEGQEIKKDDPVITIESDKSSVEIPSIFSGTIEAIKIKVGDKVSKGDLLINITNKEKISDLTKEVPKNTENLIKEAEKALELEKKQRPKIEKIEKEKSEIQFSKDGDIDPLETSEWLESLSAVIEKDGNHRGPTSQFPNIAENPTAMEVFTLVSFRHRTLSALSQAGLVEKFADCLVWAFFPIYFVKQGLTVIEIGWIVGIYGMVWGANQLWTGPLCVL